MRLLLVLIACLALPAAYATASFENPASSNPQQEFVVGGPTHRGLLAVDAPNDPAYDRAEDPGATTTNLYDERYDLFGFPSKHSPLALYADPQDLIRFGKPQISGFNASGAWKVTRGDPDVVIAILDTGIRWDRASLRTQVHLNADELPLPQNGAGQTVPGAPLNGYDLNGNGALDVDDYAGDARVGNAAPTGQDLIAEFSDQTDAEANGFVDDIAGWDFFNDDNDPNDSSSYFAASNHGSGRTAEAIEVGNDGQGEIGVCPKCQFMPIRVWDTFVSDQTNFALGILYATDNGAAVIEGADGGLYHSAFAERASDYAWEHDVVQVYSGDDLNTANHNYPAAYGHAMLIQGTATDTKGLGLDASNPDSPVGSFPDVPPQIQDALQEAAKPLAGLPVGGTELPVLTYFRGANTTQFGGKSSISMEGPTGSVNTGKSAGAAAMVISAARAKGIDLRADETRAILEQTAEDVLALNTLGAGIPDPANAGWDSHFGWGRVDLGKAVAVADSAKLPPEAAVTSPDWYAPLTADVVSIKGLARARQAVDGAFHWKLEWGVGQAPLTWTTEREADATGTVTDFGTIDLAEVREALDLSVPPIDLAGPVFAPNAMHPMAREWTVRVTVTTAGVTTPGVDRRVLNAFTDPTLRAGFPKRLGTGGEAPLRYADLDGDNVQELIAPLQDGTIHVYEPDGSELAGWPVRTDAAPQVAGHLGSTAVATVHGDAPGREPPRAALLVDFDADGAPEVVTAAGRKVYAWQADGTVRPGFPVSIDPALCRGEDQAQELKHRKCGFLASPAAARLHGPGAPQSIVAPALDGHLYAFDGDGNTEPNFPVDLVDPVVAPNDRMLAESINQPAVGDLDGDGTDEIVVATNETYDAEIPDDSALPGLIAQGLSAVLANAAGGSSRLYAVNGKTGTFLPGWPVHLNGAIQDTLPLIGPGHDATIAKIDGTEPVVVASTTGSADISIYDAGGALVRSMQQAAFGPASNATDRTGTINLFESAIVADVLGQGTPAVVKYTLTLGQVANLLLVGQNVPYNHLIGAWDATTGVPLPAFPTITDDYQFLSSSTVADVGGLSPANQILAGTGLGLLHAYDGITGLDAPGFPKYTGGWMFAPAELSADGRMASITREGFLFEWTTDAPACQPAGVWSTYRHDQQGSGNFDADGTPPAAPASVTLGAEGSDGNRALSFVSPGDDRMCGTPAAYVARVEGGDPVDVGAPVAGGQTRTAGLELPESGTLVVQARDDAGNLGHPARVAFAGPIPSVVPTETATPTTPASTPPGAPANPGTRPGVGDAVCIDATPPRSRFTRKLSRARRAGITLRGTSADVGCDKASLRRVLVAVNRAAPGGRCRALLATGRFSAPRSCHRTVYRSVTGTKSWRIRLGRRFARGKYTFWVRGIDRAGNVERKSTGRNRLKLRIR